MDENNLPDNLPDSQDSVDSVDSPIPITPPTPITPDGGIPANTEDVKPTDGVPITKVISNVLSFLFIFVFGYTLDCIYPKLPNKSLTPAIDSRNKSLE